MKKEDLCSQVYSFIDYAKKFKLKYKKQILLLFKRWARSKAFKERDKEQIWLLVQKYYQKNSKP